LAGGTQAGLAYKTAQSLKNLGRGPTVPESAYRPLVSDLGKKYPRWAEHEDLAASALETLFAFTESHYAWIEVGGRAQKIRLSDLPPTQVTVKIYEIILGNIYRFQVSN